MPYSQKWLEYWEQRIYRILTGEELGEPGCIPLEVLDAFAKPGRLKRRGLKSLTRIWHPSGVMQAGANEDDQKFLAGLERLKARLTLTSPAVIEVLIISAATGLMVDRNPFNT